MPRLFVMALVITPISILLHRLCCVQWSMSVLFSRKRLLAILAPRMGLMSSWTFVMFDCLILGDSIAVGIHSYRYECMSHSNVGITSKGYNKKYGSVDKTANVVIISLGSNDGIDINTLYEIERLRSNVVAHKVFWILPYNKKYHGIIQSVAEKYGDVVLPIRDVSPDHVHPTQKEYKNLAEQTKVVLQ